MRLLLAISILLPTIAFADAFDAYVRSNSKDPSLRSRWQHQEAFTETNGQEVSGEDPSVTASKGKDIKISAPKFSMPKASAFVSSGGSSGSSFASGSARPRPSAAAPAAAKKSKDSERDAADDAEADEKSANSSSSDTTSSLVDNESLTRKRQPASDDNDDYNVGSYDVDQQLDPKQVTRQLLGQYYEERRQRRLRAEQERRRAYEAAQARLAAREEAERKARANNRWQFGRDR